MKNLLNEEISRMRSMMGLNEAEVDANGNLVNLSFNLFDKFPEDVLETLNTNYFHLFNNFDWNAEQDKFVSANGQFDGKGFKQWIQKHEEEQVLKNLDKIKAAVRHDVIAEYREKMAELKLESFEELLLPVLGDQIAADALTKYEEMVLMNPSVTPEEILRAKDEVLNVVDDNGEVDYSKIQKSTLFTGGHVDRSKFERFVAQNPEYKKAYNIWMKLNNEHANAMVVKKNYQSSVVDYNKLKKLYNFLNTLNG